MFHVIIPARLGSERLHGKLVQDIAGKPVLYYTHLHASQSGAQSVTIATDSELIRDIAQDFGAQVVMTDAQHQCGTTRIAQAASELGLSDEAVVINVQGDEPLMVPENIQQVASLLTQGEGTVATLYQPIDEVAQIFDPNVVKVVLGANNAALYFSRAPIPWHRSYFADETMREQINTQDYLRHLGIYAQRMSTLQQYCQYSPVHAEQVERLEQLRYLAYKHAIYAAQADKTIPAGVDSASDLARLITYI